MSAHVQRHAHTMPDAAELQGMDVPAVVQLLRSQAAQIEALRAPDRVVQAPVVRPQERALRAQPDAQQMHLGESWAGRCPCRPSSPRPSGGARAQAPQAAQRLRRRTAPARLLRRTKVPVETIEVPKPEAQGLAPEQYEVIGEKISHRLAQRPGAYVVLKYVRPVIKLREHASAALPARARGRHRRQPRRRELHRRAAAGQVRLAPAAVPPAPAPDRCGLQAQPSLADAARAAGAPCCSSRSTRRSWTPSGQPRQGDGRDADQGRPGRAGGKMKAALLLADLRRARRGVLPVLRIAPARARRAGAAGLTSCSPARCCSATATPPTSAMPRQDRHHARAMLDPFATGRSSRRRTPSRSSPTEALRRSARSTRSRQEIRQKKLSGENKRLHRLTHSKPRVEEFFAWVDGSSSGRGCCRATR